MVWLEFLTTGWDNDGTRILPDFEERIIFFKNLAKYLDESRQDYVVINDDLSGSEPDWQHRTLEARVAIQRLFEEMKK